MMDSTTLTIAATATLTYFTGIWAGYWHAKDEYAHKISESFDTGYRLGRHSAEPTTKNSTSARR